ncbi:MAG: hypothetical protein RL292_558 [Candidatus Parcubacteria bacterium]|jgi:hypothetical protein
MGIITEIQGIKSRTFMIGFFDLLFLILPGIMVIFLHRIDLFQSLDWIKLVLLSASIVAPLAFMNTLAFQVVEKTNSDDGLFMDFSLGIILSGILVYIAVGLFYLLGKPLKSSILLISIIEGILFIRMLYVAYIKK